MAILNRLVESLPLGRVLLSGVAWNFAMRMLTLLTGLAVTALLARLATPEEVGAYFLIFALVTIASMLAQLGLNQSVVRLVAESLAKSLDAQARAAVRQVLLWGTGGALLTSGLVFVGLKSGLTTALLQSPLIATVSGVTALWVFVLSLQRLSAETFRGFSDIRLAAATGGFVSGLLCTVALLYVFLTRKEASLREIMWITVATVGVSVVAALWLIYGKVRHFPKGGRVGHGALLANGWPILLGNIVNVVILRVDVWILAMFAVESEVAVYGAASRLAQLVNLPVTIASAVLPPMIARLYAQRRLEELDAMLQGVTTLAALPAFLVVGVFAFFGETLLRMVYGPYFAAGGLTLAILSLGQLASAWAGGCNALLLMTGHATPLLLINLLSLVTGVGGALALAGSFGATGVAVSFAIAVILRNILAAGYGRVRIGVRSYVGMLRRPHTSALDSPE